MESLILKIKLLRECEIDIEKFFEGGKKSEKNELGKNNKKMCSPQYNILLESI